jgi:thiamine biosynthesis lipoprotein
VIERLAAAAMGTRFELVLAGASSPRAGRALRAAGEAALARIAECDARCSAFRRDSLVARINREAALRPVRVDGETYALLAACLDLWHATGGACDVGLGGALAALGLRGRAASADAFEPCAGPPCELDPGSRSVRLARPGAALDLGGVAKGWALDLAARELRELGVDRALLHGGTSSVAALGAPPGQDGWRVALEGPSAPEDPPRPAGLVVLLCDASLSVSASASRTGRDAAGGRVGHVLDPASGRPAPLGAIAAVVAPSGLAAEAWSTALVARAGSGENPRPLPPDCAAAVAARGPRGSAPWTFRGAHGRCMQPRPTTVP